MMAKQYLWTSEQIQLAFANSSPMYEHIIADLSDQLYYDNYPISISGSANHNHIKRCRAASI